MCTGLPHNLPLPKYVGGFLITLVTEDEKTNIFSNKLIKPFFLHLDDKTEEVASRF